MLFSLLHCHCMEADNGIVVCFPVHRLQKRTTSVSISVSLVTGRNSWPNSSEWGEKTFNNHGSCPSKWTFLVVQLTMSGQCL